MNYQQLKRAEDIILAIILSIIFFPIWLIVPCLIFLDSPGPIFYRHKRVGKNGKEFWLIKFRTMVENADEILFKNDKALLKRFKQRDWKLEGDPRITRLGRLLRNLTIDEFPQLWNVLKGEMSIVGPRAYLALELKEQVNKYPETKKWLKTILSAKPGITGPWQTSGRNEIPFNKRAAMDYKYAKERSFWRELLILIKTPRAMITKW